MIRLKKPEPEWLDILPGVRVLFAPVSQPAWRAARRASAAIWAADSTGDNKQDAIENAGEAFSRALIERAILDWEGVGDADGSPLKADAESISMFLDLPQCFEACDRAYVMPIVLLATEGNVSAALPDGTSAAAMQANDTVN